LSPPSLAARIEWHGCLDIDEIKAKQQATTANDTIVV
jgi:hypothetical protein